MTITTRSKRVSVFGAAPTPASVGPGAYAPERLRSSFHVEPRPLYSGFATSDRRELNPNKTTSAITPGPGAYLAGVDGPKSPGLAGSNAFATKISRFAPSAPGSTIYRPSTIQDNPGPGAYDPRPSPNNQRDDAAAPTPAHASSSSSSSNRPVALSRPSVPTIPKKEQSYGYVEDPTGAWRAQAQPHATYSGIGQDTVGPAAYSTHQAIWDERKNVAPSIRSTVQREVWQETTPRRAVPGPGQYEPSSTSSSSSSSRAVNARTSAVFASKVPILPAPKRAEHYDEERELEILAKEERAAQRRPGPPRGHKVEAFGSTTRRSQITAQQLPTAFGHAAPTSMATPGPGQYAAHGPPGFASFRGGSLRKSTHKPHGSHYREAQHIGFTSATERHCLSKLVPSGAPGPGAYRSETPRTVERNVKGKQGIGRFGVFGSTSERRVWAGLETTAPEDRPPGPGAYEQTPSGGGGGHFPMLQSSAAFKSTSARFAKLSNPHAPPHVTCVGDDATPAVGQYDIPSTIVGSPTTRPASSPTATAGGASGASPPRSARAPFLSTAERTVFESREQASVPGPGEYVVEASAVVADARTRSRDVRATLGNEERFRVRPRVPPNVGPGAYAIPGTVGTRSFNVTMAPKNAPDADNQPRRRDGRPFRSTPTPTTTTTTMSGGGVVQ